MFEFPDSQKFLNNNQFGYEINYFVFYHELKINFCYQQVIHFLLKQAHDLFIPKFVTILCHRIR